VPLKGATMGSFEAMALVAVITLALSLFALRSA
jgi:hypothetical protein